MDTVSDRGGIRGNSSELEGAREASPENQPPREAPAAGAAIPTMVQKSTRSVNVSSTHTQAADASTDTSMKGIITGEIAQPGMQNVLSSSEPIVVIRHAAAEEASANSSSAANTGNSATNTSELNALILRVNQGDPAVEFSLAQRYREGVGVDKDLQQAACWFEKAAAKGHVDAQFYLGAMYENGEGVEQNFKQAACWYKKAAEQGHAVAQLVLGAMYEIGVGVEQDFEQAVYWRLRGKLKPDESVGNEEKFMSLHGDVEDMLKCLPDVLKKYPEFAGQKRILLKDVEVSQATLSTLDQLIRFDPSIQGLIVRFGIKSYSEEITHLVAPLVAALGDANTWLTLLAFNRDIDDALQNQLDQLLEQNKVIGELRRYVLEHPAKTSDELPLEVLSQVVDKLIVHRIRRGDGKAETQAAVDEFLMGAQFNLLQAGAAQPKTD